MDPNLLFLVILLLLFRFFSKNRIFGLITLGLILSSSPNPIQAEAILSPPPSNISAHRCYYRLYFEGALEKCESTSEKRFGLCYDCSPTHVCNALVHGWLCAYAAGCKYCPEREVRQLAEYNAKWLRDQCGKDKEAGDHIVDSWACPLRHMIAPPA